MKAQHRSSLRTMLAGSFPAKMSQNTQGFTTSSLERPDPSTSAKHLHIHRLIGMRLHHLHVQLDPQPRLGRQFVVAIHQSFERLGQELLPPGRTQVQWGLQKEEVGQTSGQVQAGGGDGLLFALQRGLAQAGEALVGLDLDEPSVAPAAKGQISSHSGNLHGRPPRINPGR